MDRLTVVTFLWSDPDYRWNRQFRYGADHVRRLAAGVRRHLSMPHEFVVVTDSGADFGPDVRVVPLWSDFREAGGCYTRLRAFAPDMASILGPRFVWLDLDAVVVGSLDPVFDRPEPFVAWRNVHRGQIYCGAMMMMDAGARSQVWDRFRADPLACRREAQQRGYIGTDQAVISLALGKDEATWTSADGVWNYQHEIVAKHAGRLPDGARLVFFNGPRDPSMTECRKRSPWIAEHWTC